LTKKSVFARHKLCVDSYWGNKIKGFQVQSSRFTVHDLFSKLDFNKMIRSYNLEL